nr:hypothetical protein L203_04776 [Cryptococcus depauperatus CBS 7841]
MLNETSRAKLQFQFACNKPILGKSAIKFVQSVSTNLFQYLLQVRTTNKGNGTALPKFIEGDNYFRRDRLKGKGKGAIHIKYTDSVWEWTVSNGLIPGGKLITEAD